MLRFHIYFLLSETITVPYPLCGKLFVRGTRLDVRFERVVLVRGVYFDHIDVGPQAISIYSKVERSYFALIRLHIEI